MAEETKPKEQFAEIKRLADEFRVKAHLASMDAKNMWDEDVKPQFRDLESRFDKAVDKSKLSEELGKLEKKMRKLVDNLTD